MVIYYRFKENEYGMLKILSNELEKCRLKNSIPKVICHRIELEIRHRDFEWCIFTYGSGSLKTAWRIFHKEGLKGCTLRPSVID